MGISNKLYYLKIGVFTNSFLDLRRSARLAEKQNKNVPPQAQPKPARRLKRAITCDNRQELIATVRKPAMRTKRAKTTDTRGNLVPWLLNDDMVSAKALADSQNNQKNEYAKLSKELQLTKTTLNDVLVERDAALKRVEELGFRLDELKKYFTHEKSVYDKKILDMYTENAEMKKRINTVGNAPRATGKVYCTILYLMGEYFQRLEHLTILDIV